MARQPSVVPMGAPVMGMSVASSSSADPPPQQYQQPPPLPRFDPSRPVYVQPRADKLETFAGKWVPIRVREWSNPSSVGQSSISFDARGVMSWSQGGGRGTATMHFDSPVAYVHCSGGYTNTWCSDPSGNGLTDRIDVFPDGTIWMEAGSEFWAKEGSPAAIEAAQDVAQYQIQPTGCCAIL